MKLLQQSYGDEGADRHRAPQSSVCLVRSQFHKPGMAQPITRVEWGRAAKESIAEAMTAGLTKAPDKVIAGDDVRSLSLSCFFFARRPLIRDSLRRLLHCPGA